MTPVEALKLYRNALLVMADQKTSHGSVGLKSEITKIYTKCLEILLQAEEAEAERDA